LHRSGVLSRAGVTCVVGSSGDTSICASVDRRAPSAHHASDDFSTDSLPRLRVASPLGPVFAARGDPPPPIRCWPTASTCTITEIALPVSLFAIGLRSRLGVLEKLWTVPLRLCKWVSGQIHTSWYAGGIANASSLSRRPAGLRRRESDSALYGARRRRAG
jgi:hypothetical protein